MQLRCTPSGGYDSCAYLAQYFAQIPALECALILAHEVRPPKRHCLLRCSGALHCIALQCLHKLLRCNWNCYAISIARHCYAILHSIAVLCMHSNAYACNALHLMQLSALHACILHALHCEAGCACNYFSKILHSQLGASPLSCCAGFTPPPQPFGLSAKVSACFGPSALRCTNICLFGPSAL